VGEEKERGEAAKRGRIREDTKRTEAKDVISL